MKVTGTKKIETVIDVLCDVCGCSCSHHGNHQEDLIDYGVLKASWGYGSKHDGEQYEVQLCETCFFQALANCKEQRRANRMFENENDQDSNFGQILPNAQSSDNE